MFSAGKGASCILFECCSASTSLVHCWRSTAGHFDLAEAREEGRLWKAASEDPAANVLLFVYSGFERDRYYWEFIIFARKVALSMVMVVTARWASERTAGADHFADRIRPAAAQQTISTQHCELCREWGATGDIIGSVHWSLFLSCRVQMETSP